MRILVVGTRGVGSAFARVATRRPFFEHCALADYDPARPREVVAGLDDGRFSALLPGGRALERTAVAYLAPRPFRHSPSWPSSTEYGAPHGVELSLP